MSNLKETDFPIELFVTMDEENSEEDFLVLNYSAYESDVLDDSFQTVAVYKLQGVHEARLKTTARVIRKKDKS